MKRFLLLAVLVTSLFRANTVSAQTTIIGPNSLFSWDMTNTPLATANTLVYTITVDATAPKVLTPFTCIGSVTVLTTTTCSVNAIAALPMGTHSLTMTAASGALVSAPSALYSYTVMLITIPTNLRVQ
jgi:hypothetical protein